MPVATDPHSIYIEVDLTDEIVSPDSTVLTGKVHAKVSLGRELLLQCSEDRATDWCPHIEKVVSENLDSQFIADPDSSWEGLTIPVPLIPSANQWASVKFGELVEKVGAYKVYFEAEDGKSNIKIDDLPFLGFFTHGEGRAVLRGMVYDYFRGELAKARVEKIKIQCTLSSHSFKQEILWQADLKADGERRLLQYWSVLNTGACIGCHSIRIDTEEDDLIPDPGTRAGRSPF